MTLFHNVFKIIISHKLEILLKGGLSMKKFLSLLLALLMVFTLAACNNGGGNTPAEPSGSGDSSDKFKIAIVTGSVSQSEDDRRGAEAIQA